MAAKSSDAQVPEDDDLESSEENGKIYEITDAGIFNVVCRFVRTFISDNTRVLLDVTSNLMSICVGTLLRSLYPRSS